jgi:hypothetical protein
MKRVVQFLFKNPVGTGCLYLAMILVFAATYSTINYHFYDSTIQMEKDFFWNKEDIRKDVVTQLEKDFAEVAHQIVNDISYLPEIYIRELKIDDHKIEGDANLGFINRKNRYCIGCINIEFTIYHSDFRRLSLDKRPVRCKIKSDAPNHGFGKDAANHGFGKNAPIGFEEHENLTILGKFTVDALSTTVKFFDNYRFFTLYEQTMQKISIHLQAQKGISTIKSGKFLRFFYFSVVTATTLGYGDILPVSNTARLLISLESILGLVLIGLFLYNITNREKS